MMSIGMICNCSKFCAHTPMAKPNKQKPLVIPIELREVMGVPMPDGA